MQDSINFTLTNEDSLLEISVTGDLSSVGSRSEDFQRVLINDPLDFKKITISYMNNEAISYGYPDIFAAMSLKNSSIPELVAEGVSWTDFFDAGMTYVDYQIKSDAYIGFENSIISIKEDSTSPKVNFAPSLTYPSVAE